jgi:hypothetical protein
VGTAIKGLVAGAIGTAAMTAYQTAVIKARGSEASTTPAEVGKRVIEGVFHRRVPDDAMGALNNVMHVLYGTGWGSIYGIVHGSSGRGALRDGLAFGTAVWLTSLIELPALKVAPPVWEYPPKETALDLSYHLVYGLGVAGGYAAIEG